MPGMTLFKSSFKADNIIIEFHTMLFITVSSQLLKYCHFERHLLDWSVRQNQVFPFVLRHFDFLLFLRRGHSSLDYKCSRFEGILIKCFPAQRSTILRNSSSSVHDQDDRDFAIGTFVFPSKREKNRSLPSFGTSQMAD